jgi:hypothetical protein
MLEEEVLGKLSKKWESLEEEEESYVGGVHKVRRNKVP